MKPEDAHLAVGKRVRVARYFSPCHHPSESRNIVEGDIVSIISETSGWLAMQIDERLIRSSIAGVNTQVFWCESVELIDDAPAAAGSNICTCPPHLLGCGHPEPCKYRKGN